MMADDDLKATTWTGRIDEAMAAEKCWRDKGENVVKIYRGERTATGAEGRARFNILYANVSILAPAVYQQPPQADVRRRFSRANPAADDASSILQSALNASFEVSNLDDEVKRCVHDNLLPGRGTIRVRWSPVMQDVPVMDAMGMPVIDQDGQPVTRSEKVWEALEYEHVYWEDFLCEPVRRWSNCAWVAFRHFLTKAEIEEQFGDDENVVNRLSDEMWVKGAFVHSPAETGSPTDNTRHMAAIEPRAMVWECWDKTRRIIDWIIPGQSPLRLRRDEDFLELEGFYPCPEPMLSVATTDTMIPVPEYEIYKDLAIEIGTLTERIDAIVDRMKVRGIVNGSIEELVEAFDGEDGRMIPIAQVDMAQAMSQNVWMIPLDMLAQTAVALYNAREQSKVALYEVTGISDVLRGASVAGETATAQRIKGNFGTLRIDDRRRALSNMLKRVVQIAAEIMASKFSPQTLSMMTGREVSPELEQYLRNEAQLMCHVDIETDSTIAADQAAEQESAKQLVEAVGGVIATFGPLVQQGVVPIAAVTEMLKMILKPFKGSRDVLDIIAQIGEQQPEEGQQQPEGPTPEQQAEMAKLERENAEAQQDMQIKAEKHALDMAEGQQDMQLAAQRGQLDAMKAQAQVARSQMEPFEGGFSR